MTDSDRFPSFQRIALISDIHGNLPALEAVYHHAIQFGVIIFLNAGDTLGYGPFPNECLNFLRSHHIISVIGDYDLKVLHYPEKEDKFKMQKNALRVLSFQWAHDRLSEENLQYLQQLPLFREVDFAGKTLYLTHGAPLNIKTHLGSLTTRQEWLDNQREAGTDFIITGNSHRFWKEKIENSNFINPGSVGRQDDGDPRASYAILSIGKFIQINHFRIAYDLPPLINKLQAYNLPAQFIYMFKNGVNLEQALEELSQDH
ncbi:MAG: metallophosphoesterase family protein [Chloroflexi bacterium]|nr:metallophosphoesterase family protein [Chloroflexota bacterium]